MKEENRACSTAPKLIFACCGAADVGEIADRAARKLHKDGSGKMFCLTGIGAGLSTFIESTNAASRVLAIDGCPIDCTKKLLEKYSLNPFEFIRVTDLGFEKGKSLATEAAVETVSAKCRLLLEGEVL